MNLNITSKVAAKFKMQVYKASDFDANGQLKQNSKPCKETDWFDNIVLDSGLRRLSAGDAAEFLAVGSGNSTPVVTQTGLDALLATTNVKSGFLSGRQLATSPIYTWMRSTYRFAVGAAKGNIAEVGLGWFAGTSNNMFNRALIRDINGNPVVITVLEDEILDVLVELRHYWKESFSGSFTLKDKTGVVISTHTYTGKPLLAADPTTFVLNNSKMISLNVLSGSMSTSYDTPPNTGWIARENTPISSSYPTTTSERCVFRFAENSGNGSQKTLFVGIPNLVSWFPSDFNVNGYQWQIDPPITKNNTQTLSYTFTLNWDRYTS